MPVRRLRAMPRVLLLAGWLATILMVPTATAMTLAEYAGPIHIGDGESASCNPSSPSGTSFSLPFTVPFEVSSVSLHFEGAQVWNLLVGNRVYVNGELVGVIPRSPADDCGIYDSYFESEIGEFVNIGGNTLTIETAFDGTNYDDIWLRGFAISATAAEEPPVYVEGPVHLGDGVSSICDPASPSGTVLSVPFVLTFQPAEASVFLRGADVWNLSPGNVVAVNGVSVGIIPRSPSDDCDIYDTEFSADVSALVHEGENELSIESAYSDGYDDIWLRDISLAAAPPGGPPFEILSATFDRDHYQNGVDTAHLTVVTRSNWGSGDIGIQPHLIANTGESYYWAGDFFPLEPDQQHVSGFDWPIPDRDFPWEFDLEVELCESGEFVTAASFPGFVGSPLSDVEQQAVVEQVQDCTTTWDDCFSSLVAVVPLLGAPLAQQDWEHAMCILHEQVAMDYTPGIIAAGFLAGLTAVDAFFAFWEIHEVTSGAPISVVPNLVVSAPLAVGWCLDALLNDLGKSGRAAGVVPGIAEASRVVGEEHGRSYADRIFVSGARMSVLADSAEVTADSTNLNDCLVWEFPSGPIEMGYVGRNPHRFGSGNANPHASVLLRTTATVADTVNLVILHRTMADSVLWLEWEPVSVDSLTVLELDLADSLDSSPTDFGLRVDRDGDGYVDEVLYPGLPSAVEGVDIVGKEGVVLRARAQNPSPGQVSLFVSTGRRVQAAVLEIMDVSGRTVRKVSLGDLMPGSRNVEWDGRGDDGCPAGSGVYFARIAHRDGQTQAQKVTILR